mmetsp:Transcript_30860/g.80928  ORF Transcript_30860/g.80928 Transcript_30860/m.80928 type:complete len:487 (-) Transcript_30860:1406-2866(-)
MHKQQLHQIAELTNCVVRRVDRLHAFVTADTDTNVCSLDHGHVIRTITNSQSHGLGTDVVLDKSNNLSLLLWGHTASNNSLADNTDLQQQTSHLLVTENVTKRRAVDDKGKLFAYAFALNNGSEPVGLSKQLTASLFRSRAIDNDEHHLLGEEAAGKADVDGRFLLVSSEHPNLHASLGKSCNSVGHTNLEFVFNCSGANNLKILLNLFCNSHELVFTVLDRCAGILILLEPIGVHLGSKLTLAQNQGTETLFCHVNQGKSKALLFIRLIFINRLSQSLKNDSISTFGHQHDFALRGLADDGHSLASTVELINTQDFVLVFFPENRDSNMLASAGKEPISDRPCCLHKSFLIRGCSLIDNFAFIHLVSFGNNSMTHREVDQKAMNTFMVGICWIFGCLAEANIIKFKFWVRVKLGPFLVLVLFAINASSPRGIVLPLCSCETDFRRPKTILSAVNIALPKFHFVPCKGSSLVGEDVFNLAKIFHDI